MGIGSFPPCNRSEVYRPNKFNSKKKKSKQTSKQTNDKPNRVTKIKFNPVVTRRVVDIDETIESPTYVISETSEQLFLKPKKLSEIPELVR